MAMQVQGHMQCSASAMWLIGLENAYPFFIIQVKIGSSPHLVCEKSQNHIVSVLIILATTVNAYTPATSLENHTNCRAVSAGLLSNDSRATFMWNILLGTSHAWMCSLLVWSLKPGVRGPSPTVTGPHFCRIQMFSLFLELKKKKKNQSRNAVCTFNRSQALLSPSGGYIHRLWSLLVKADPGDVGRLTQTKGSFLGWITPWLTEWCWVSQRHLLDLLSSVFTPEAVGTVYLNPWRTIYG